MGANNTQCSNSNEDVVSSSTSKNKQVTSSSKSSLNYRKASKVSPSPAKPRAPLHLRRENYVTPTTKMSTIDSMDRKKSNPKSLRMLMNSTPAKEHDKLATPSVKKIESSRVVPSSSKASKDCLTPLRTPTTVILLSQHFLGSLLGMESFMQRGSEFYNLCKEPNILNNVKIRAQEIYCIRAKNVHYFNICTGPYISLDHHNFMHILRLLSLYISRPP